jgi:hypothetical protein
MRVTIDKACRDKLKQEANQTDAGPSKLLRGKRGIAPEGLTSSMIHGWISGRIKTAKKEHFDWVLNAYAKYQPPQKPTDERPNKLKLTKAHRELIKHEVERTGLGAINILRHAPKPLPEGLNHQKVQRWISGQTTSADKTHWEFVLRLYGNIQSYREGHRRELS